jgi:uncharacterized membrane protein
MSAETGRATGAGAATGPESAPRPARIWEIDFLRGLSIILMVFYHLFYDLWALSGISKFLGVSIVLSNIYWSIAQYFFAGLFIVLSGISSTLSRSNIRRGLRLFGFAIIVSAATYVFDPSSVILFGILHCLAVSILIYGLALERSISTTCAYAGAAVLGLSVAVSLMMKQTTVGFDWLLPLGIHTPAYSAADYFPLLPWLGIFLVGTALGKSVYAAKRSLIRGQLPVSFINVAGRHSLLIYIIHQPVILGVLYVLGLLR